jgi:hypothetical protein
MVKTTSMGCLALIIGFWLHATLPDPAATSEPFSFALAKGVSSATLTGDVPGGIPAPAAQVSPTAVLMADGGKRTDSFGARQKDVCDGHLRQLRELFLKTRKHASRRAHCETADNGAAFLEVIETCRRDCPPQLLEQNGYSSRVIRYITALHKIGEERCRATLEAAPPPPDRSPTSTADPPDSQGSP